MVIQGKLVRHRVSRSVVVGWLLVRQLSKAQGITPGQWRHMRTDLVNWVHGRSWHSFACAAFRLALWTLPVRSKRNWL
ncbi:hypothetical protein ASF72_10535 [Arthrobacter sp. Leaf141]|nr:hypothetical protein ASF72_10535 [Arthrobacter sp. Leaf141]